MASLRRVPDSKFWIACFTDRDGRRRQRSTKVIARGTANRRKAQLVAETFEAAARTARTVRQAQRVVADLIREMTGEDAPKYTVRGWAERWLKSQRAITSPRTMDRYEGQTSRFVDYLGVKADAQLSDITRRDIEGYRDARLAGVSLKTVKHELDCLRRLFKSAVDDGVLVESPAAAIKLPKPTAARQTSRRAFTSDELHAIMRVAGPEWRSLVTFGLYTGQRLGDLARLTWANLDTAAGVVRLTTGKTGAALTIPIAAPLERHIATLPVPADPSAPLHPRAHDVLTRHGKVAMLSNEFRAILEDAGLAERKPHRVVHGRGREGRREVSPLSFHSMRHTATSAMKNAGMPDSIVMATVGHESASISRGYTHADMEAMKRAVDSLPDIVNE